MRTQPLGGKNVSVIGLGTAEFGGACPEGKARDFMDAYAALGGNLIDTARVYGDFRMPRNGESEKVIGRWLAARHNRDSVFLSTKGGHPRLSSMQKSRLSQAEVRADAEESLNDLQVNRVDVYFLHRDDESRPVGELMETLQSLVDDGLTDAVGVSNWRLSRIREASAYAKAHGLSPLFANQPQFSLARQAYCGDPTLVSMDEATLRFHRETGVACFCFSSQARGFFTKLAQFGTDGLPEPLKKQFFTKENLKIYEKILLVQQETGLSAGAIALAYLTSQPFPCFPLAGASRIEHVQALAEAGDAMLTPAQLTALTV